MHLFLELQQQLAALRESASSTAARQPGRRVSLPRSLPGPVRPSVRPRLSCRLLVEPSGEPPSGEPPLGHGGGGGTLFSGERRRPAVPWISPRSATSMAAFGAVSEEEHGGARLAI